MFKVRKKYIIPLIKLRRSRIFTLYSPVLMEQGLATILTMLGTMLVSSVGAAAVSGVGMIDTLNYCFMNALVAIGTGVTAIVSQCVGSGKIKDAAKAASHSISIAIYSSIFLGAVLIIFREPILYILFHSAEAEVISSAYDYLFFTSASLPLLAVFNIINGVRRGTGDNLTPLIGSAISTIVYVIVSLICIHVFKMGVRGVGYGLLLSRIVQTIILVYCLIRYPRMIKIKKIPLKVNMDILKPVLNIAIPSAMDSLVFNGGKVLVMVFMSNMGTASLAANTICNSLSNFLQLPGRTYQITSVTLTGRDFGTGDFKKTRKTMISQTYFTMISQVFMSIIFFILYIPLIHLFTYDSEIIEICRKLMYLIYVATPLFWATSFVTPNALRATGDAFFTMVISMTSMILCRVIGSWFLGVYLDIGVFGIWLAMTADWVIRSIFYIPRVFSTKWQRTIVK